MTDEPKEAEARGEPTIGPEPQPDGEVQRAELLEQVQQMHAQNIEGGEREIAEILERRKLAIAPMLITTASGMRFELPLRPRG